MSATPIHTPPSPPPVPPRRRRRWPWIVLAVLVLLVLVAVGAVMWVLHTGAGTRYVIERATRMAGEGVRIEGVEGAVGGPMRIKRIEVSRPEMYALVEDVELETSPLGSLRGTLLVHKLVARSVEVRTVSTQATAKIPESFAPPYGVKLDEGRIGTLRKGDLTREAAAEKDPVRKRQMMDASREGDLVIRDLLLRGSGDKQRWVVDEASVVTTYGQARLAGRLDNVAPFAIDMKASMQGTAAERDYRADATAKGSLKSMEVALDGVVSGQPATARATLEPFSNLPLRSLQAKASGVDLQKLAGGPRTKLDVDVRLDGATQANAFAGPVRLANAAPGRWDQGALPFTSATARVVVTQDRLDIADLVLQLAGGGSASGRAVLTKAGIEADLAVADVDLAALHGSLQKTRVTGRIAASGDKSAQRFDVALRDPRFSVEGRGGLANERLELATVRISTGGGAVTAKGEMAFSGRKAFRFEGDAQHFDPSAFVKTTKGDLNFTFTATGSLADPPSGELRADIAPSNYAGLPARGRVLVAGDAKRIANADIDVTLGDAHLAAKGAFGRTGDAMNVSFRVPNLSVVAKPFGVALVGRAEGEGQLTGTFDQPAGRITLTGGNLALPGDAFVRDLALRAQAGVAADSPIDVDVQAKGVALGKETPRQPFAESIAATMKGTRADHRVEVTAVMTQETTARVAVQGGLDPRAKTVAWNGRLTTLGMTGRGAFSLQAPASLSAAPDRVELGDARLKGEWGEAHLAVTRWTPRTLDLKGSSPGIEIQNIARSLKMGELARSNLVLALDWDVRAAESFNGTVSMRRVSGDLRVGDPVLPLGLQVLEVEAQAVQGQANARMRVEGERTGRLTGTGSGRIVRGATGWEFAANAPMQARVVAEHGNLEALSPWLGVDGKLGGRLDADVRVTGTGADPQVSGQVRLANLVVREPQTGFEVDQGEVALRLDGRTLAVQKLELRTPWRPVAAARENFRNMTVPQSGTISAEGTVDIAKRTGNLRVKLQQAVLTQTSGRFVAVSGEAAAESGADAMVVKGDFKADAAWVGALETAPPSVSEDVIVVRASQPIAEEPKKAGVPIRLDLRFNLGNRVYFEGRGLDTRLTGELHIQGSPGAELRATGTIRTLGGTYKGYGQNLTIERGVLQFAGPIDNPRLNVLAVRKGLAVEPGVEVLGTVSRPRIRLVSTPDVPEPEKLSWLVLGRGPSELAPGDASVLLAAATSMMGGNNPGQDLGKRFGLDEVKIGRADNGSILGVLPQSTVAGKTGSPSAAQVVTVGKRLTRDLSLAYEQGLGDAEGALKLAWRITRNFQVLVRAGFLPGVDAVYRWSFR